MPDRHVVLLRGINVGRAKRVAMEALRALLADAGFGGVRTLLATGNVVLDPRGAPPDEVAARVERALLEGTGVSARAVAVPAAELDAVLAVPPFAGVADDPSRLLVAVGLDADFADRVAPLVARDWGAERLAAGPGRTAYLWCPQGVSDSALVLAVSRAVRDVVTMRTWTTIERLASLAREPA